MGMADARFLKDHDLPTLAASGVRHEKREARTPEGQVAAGLYNACIWLENPTQYNS